MTLTKIFSQLAGGMWISIQIFFVTLIFSLPLGLFISFGRMSKNPVIRTIVKFYISVMRGTPLMLQLMVVYFGPYYLFKIKVGNNYRLWAAFIGFVVNYAAYFAEIYRSGIQSMPVGQYEAAKLEDTDVFSDYISTGDETDSPLGNERGHHAGQGHLPGIYHQRPGDVCSGKGTGVLPDKPDSVCGGGPVLLHI